MSTFYIKQAFSIRDSFEIKDSDNQPVWRAEGKMWSWKRILQIQDLDGHEVLRIEQKLWSFLPTYHIYLGDELVAEVKKKMTFFKAGYQITPSDWTIEGDVWGYNFDISDDETPIAHVKKTVFSWTDHYEIDVLDDQHALISCAFVIVVNAIFADLTAASSN